MNMRVNLWLSLDTAGRQALIREVYEPGMSASEIAAAIGGVTRNAIIGHYGRSKGALAADCPLRASTHTIGKMRRKVPRASRPLTLAMNWRGSQHNPPPAFFAEPTEYDSTSRRVSLMELGPHDCKWPVNAAAPGEGHLFCGYDRLMGSSYCEHHQGRSVRLVTERMMG